MYGRILVNKKTGDLFEAYRICLFDKNVLTYEGKYSITIEQREYDGWIITNPVMGPNGIFFNKSCEEWFEDLGEL